MASPSGAAMDEGDAILQSLMATKETLITAPWQYEDAMPVVASDRRFLAGLSSRVRKSQS